MLSIVAITEIEDCLDDLVVREYHLSVPLSADLMRRLALGASLQYFPHFPRPFFKVRRPGFFTIQGIVGNTYFRVTFSPALSSGHDQVIRDALGIDTADVNHG